jgi:hypothetical protein
MPLLLYPLGKSPWYPWGRRLGGPQSQSGCCGEERNLALLGIDPGPSIRHTVHKMFVNNFYLINYQKKIEDIRI